MKTDEEVRKDRDDVEMIKRPHMWPHMLLPIKRSHPEKEYRLQTGVLGHLENGKIAVRVNGNIWGEIEEATTQVYDDADAVVADGWIVD